MRKYNDKLKKTAAFTLIEIVIVILIGSVFIPSIVIALNHASKKGAENLSTYRYAAVADSILARKVEELISLPYLDSRLNNTSGTVFQTQEQDFTGTYSIGYVNESLASSQTDTGCKKVSIRVVTPENKEYIVNAYITAWK
jgi:type II secretory pathway pseudopilin PulG